MRGGPDIGQWVGRAFIAGLCAAAVAAIAALVTGDLGDTELRIIGMSIGFSVFAATAGAGEALRSRARGARRRVGTAAIAASIAAYGLLVAVLWSPEFESEWLWQAFGIAAVLALCASHASLVLRSARHDDTRSVRALVSISIAAATVDTALAVLTIAEAFDDVAGAWVQFGAVVLVVMLLTTALPPLLRRFGPGAGGRRPATDAFGRADAAGALSLGALAEELADAAGRLERLDGSADVRREAAALRELAARARGEAAR